MLKQQIIFVCTSIALYSFVSNLAFNGATLKKTTILSQQIEGMRRFSAFVLRHECTARHRINGIDVGLTRSFNTSDEKGASSETPGKILYKTIYGSEICGCNAVIVECPSRDQLLSIDNKIDIGDIMKEELEYGTTKFRSSNRYITYIGGRVAVRRAYASHNNDGKLIQTPIPPILKNDLGAPTLPEGMAGSISHKDHFAMGATRLSLGANPPTITNSTLPSGHLGIDMERCTSQVYDKIQKRLLTDNEQMTLGRLNLSSATCHIVNGAGDQAHSKVVKDVRDRGQGSGIYTGNNNTQRMQCDRRYSDICSEMTTRVVTTEEEVLLRFSFKEAIFKAVNPFVRRYVDFSEAEIFPSSDGTAMINFRLQTGELFEYVAEWRKIVIMETFGESGSIRDNVSSTEDGEGTLVNPPSSKGCREYWLTAVYLYNPHSNACD